MSPSPLTCKTVGTVLAAIDKQGNGQFTRFNEAGEPGTITNFALPLAEADWCGVCIHPTDPVAAAVASLNRAIGLFSLETGDMIAFRNALQPPSSVRHLACIIYPEINPVRSCHGYPASMATTDTTSSSQREPILQHTLLPQVELLTSIVKLSVKVRYHPRPSSAAR